MELKDLENIPADDFDDEEEEKKTFWLCGLTIVAFLAIGTIILLGYFLIKTL